MVRTIPQENGPQLKPYAIVLMMLMRIIQQKARGGPHPLESQLWLRSSRLQSQFSPWPTTPPQSLPMSCLISGYVAAPQASQLCSLRICEDSADSSQCGNGHEIIDGEIASCSIRVATPASPHQILCFAPDVAFSVDCVRRMQLVFEQARYVRSTSLSCPDSSTHFCRRPTRISPIWPWWDPKGWSVGP